MFNYMRSELYRIFHSRSFYVTMAGIMSLPILVNVVLRLMYEYENTFQYAVTSFSYSNFGANPMWATYCALGITYMLYEKDRQSGNLKNVMAFGISRTKIFVGQCVVSVVACTIVLIMTLLAYIGSAELLLKQAGPMGWRDVLLAAAAVFLIAVAAVVLCVATMRLFKDVWSGILAWIVVFEGIPTILYLFSLKYPVVENLAMWSPKYFLSMSVVNMTTFEPMWYTIEGAAKCGIVGIAAIAVFGAIGLLSSRKMEL